MKNTSPTSLLYKRKQDLKVYHTGEMDWIDHMIPQEILQTLLERKKLKPISMEQLVNQMENWFRRHAKIPKNETVFLDWFVVKDFNNPEGPKDKVHFGVLKQHLYTALGISYDREEESLRAKSLGTKNLDRFEKGALKGTLWNVSQYVDAGTICNFSIERPAKTVKKPKYLFHATLEKNTRKILKTGIKPYKKTGSSTLPTGRENPDILFRYPQQRVYLTKKPSHAMRALLNDLGIDKNIVVFRIDTRKFSKFNLFLDRTEDDAYYTFTHIPANALSIVWKGKTKYKNKIYILKK